MNFKKTIIFLIIIISYFYSYSQKDSLIHFRCDTRPVKSYSISGLYLSREYVDSLDVPIDKIKISRYKIFKGSDTVYAKTKAIVLLNRELIVKKRIKIDLLSQIKEQEIKSIEFLDKKEARKRFGWWRGRYGTIIIETKEPTTPDE